MKNDFDELIRLGRDADALRHLADEYYKNGKMGHTRKRLLERAADKLDQMGRSAEREIARLRKECASLAIESVKREKALARLEAEVAATIGGRGEWTRKETNGGTLAICSQCKYPVSYWHKTKYCGECGANMEEVE